MQITYNNHNDILNQVVISDIWPKIIITNAIVIGNPKSDLWENCE